MRLFYIRPRNCTRSFGTRCVGRLGIACLDGTIGAGPNLSKRASRVGRVSQPRAPTPRPALPPPNLIEDNGDCIVVTSRRDVRSYVLTEDERGLSLPSRVSETPWSHSASPNPSNTRRHVSHSARTRADSHTHGHVVHTSGSLGPRPTHGIHHFEEVPTVLRTHLDYRSRGIHEMPIIRMRSRYPRWIRTLALGPVRIR